MTANRRLAAILAADVVGYSRLMEADEAGTLAALKARRKGVLEPLVAKHHGRVFKIAGDGVLIEFASAVNAVQCAIELQTGFSAANSDLTEDRFIGLRIGVHVGDVMVEGTDLYGDGVNIAARLEALAEPGGILLSEDARRQVGAKLAIGFDDLGPQSLKNIDQQVRAFCVAGHTPPGVPKNLTKGEKPSIAVLPFTNMSGDSEQEYFSDGLTEDIITELSRFRSLFVIARNSSFQFKEKNVDVRKVANDLGVQYILEGSVRKMGERLRITAQFIDAGSGSHLWSERYDRSMTDVFAIQDEVVRAITGSLEIQLAANVAERARKKPPSDLRAYELVLQARAFLAKQEPFRALPLLHHAIEIDPNYAQAYAELTYAFVFTYFFDSKRSFLERAVEFGQQAIALDPNDAHCHCSLGEAYLFLRDFERASVHFEKGVMLNENDIVIKRSYAHWLARTGEADRAIKLLELATRLDTFPPDWALDTRINALWVLKRHQDIIQTIQRVQKLQVWHHAYLAACNTMLGNSAEAQKSAADTMRAKPDFTIGWLLLQEPYRQRDVTDHITECLKLAGLPE